MENFDYFIAKQAREFFREYDDRYDILDLLYNEPKPVLEYPTTSLLPKEAKILLPLGKKQPKI